MAQMTLKSLDRLTGMLKLSRGHALCCQSSIDPLHHLGRLIYPFIMFGLIYLAPVPLTDVLDLGMIALYFFIFSAKIFLFFFPFFICLINVLSMLNFG